jgi:uncharacterized protein involved in propanediol utilization
MNVNGERNRHGVLATPVDGRRHDRMNSPQTGAGTVYGDHGELLHGVFEVGGRLRAGRVMLPCANLVDPVVFDHLVLVAQRDGTVLEDFGAPIPPVDVLGFSLRPLPRRSAHPTYSYTAWEIEYFRALRGLLRHAAIREDVAALGRVATASARLNERLLPTPCFADLAAIADACSAVGLQIAHCRPVGGLLFDPADHEREEKIAHAAHRLARAGVAGTWRFNAGGAGHAVDLPDS